MEQDDLDLLAIHLKMIRDTINSLYDKYNLLYANQYKLNEQGDIYI